MAAKDVPFLSLLLFLMLESDDLEVEIKLGVHAAALADRVDCKK